MPFSNQDYIYSNLPGRYRTADKALFTKRFLQYFGGKMDDWDAAFDGFYQNIAPTTATATWISFWLLELFGWSWFPSWFTLTDKRRVYGNFAKHIARRGTRIGIEKFLLDFGIVARVHTKAITWGEFVWGETAFSITTPLRLVIEIVEILSPQIDLSEWGESGWGEAYWTNPQSWFTNDDILGLVRYMQPTSQSISIVWQLPQISTFDDGTIYWQQIEWNQFYWTGTLGF